MNASGQGNADAVPEPVIYHITRGAQCIRCSEDSLLKPSIIFKVPFHSGVQRIASQYLPASQGHCPPRQHRSLVRCGTSRRSGEPRRVVLRSVVHRNSDDGMQRRHNVRDIALVRGRRDIALTLEDLDAIRLHLLLERAAQRLVDTEIGVSRNFFDVHIAAGGNRSGLDAPADLVSESPCAFDGGASDRVLDFSACRNGIAVDLWSLDDCSVDPLRWPDLLSQHRDVDIG